MRGHPVDEVVSSRRCLPGISRWLGQDAPTRLTAAVAVPVIVVAAEPAKSRAEAG